MVALGERQVLVDCDVLQADGGTRTASISGAWIALHDALTRWSVGSERHPIVDHLAAVSVGIIDGECRLDLPYEEDSRAEVDMNVVMTGDGRLVEVQGTAEQEAVPPRRARRACSTWPRRASVRSWRCSARWSPSPRRRV